MKFKFNFLFIIMIVVFSSFALAVDEPVIKVSVAKTDPIIVESGEYFDLWVKVENVGRATAKEVIVEFLDNYPFTVEEDHVEKIGVLGQYNDYIVNYRVRVDSNAVEGMNTLKFRYTSGGINGVYVETEQDINVENLNSELVIGNIESNPLNLVADMEDAKLTINIQNVGESKAKLVKAELELPDGFESSTSFSDTYSISSIDADDSQDAVFYIDVNKDVVEGEYKARLKLSYKEENNAEYITKTLLFDIPVKATPLFEIIDTNFDVESIEPSNSVNMIVTLKNVGGKDAESVSLRAFQNVGLPIEFDEKSNFVGTIKAGETGQAVLKFTVDDNAVAKNYLLDLEIRAISNDDVLVFDKTVDFNITDAKRSSSTRTMVIIGVLVVLAIAAWFYFKKD